jgi:hypothetical protein
MNDLKCPVHGIALVGKEVPIFYGMPTLDSDIFEIGRRFPHHGLCTDGMRYSKYYVPISELHLPGAQTN